MMPGAGGRLPCPDCPARAATLCAGLADADMPRLYALATELRFAPGELLLRQEQPADFIYSMRAGHATVFRLTADGRRQVLAFLFPGDFVGFTAEDSYHYGVAAIDPVFACRFERGALESLIAEFPSMDRKLRFTLVRAMDAAFELQFSLGRKDAVQKIASFLWYVSYRQRKLDLPGSPVHLPMRRADIADFMGLTTETVSRSLTVLRRSGAIRLSGVHEVVITDLERLRAIGLVAAEPAPYRHRDPDHYRRKHR